MENFGDRIDYWDVFNEITVDHLYHNAVSRWIHEKGRANAVRYTTKLVRRSILMPISFIMISIFGIKSVRFCWKSFAIWGLNCKRWEFKVTCIHFVDDGRSLGGL